MSKTVEAVVWCPKCQADKFTVYRVSTGSEDVYTHEAIPAAQKLCDLCGSVLERKQ